MRPASDPKGIPEGRSADNFFDLTRMGTDARRQGGKHRFLLFHAFMPA